MIFDKFEIFIGNFLLFKLCAKYNNTSYMIMPLCQKMFKYNCFNVFVTAFNMIKSIKQKKINLKVVKKNLLTTCIVSTGATNYILFTMVLRRKFSTFYNTLRCK